MTTQRDLVADYIKKHGSITSLEAFQHLGVTRLSAVIFDMEKKYGYTFGKSTVESVSKKTGRRVSFTRYRFL